MFQNLKFLLQWKKWLLIYILRTVWFGYKFVYSITMYINTNENWKSKTGT